MFSSCPLRRENMYFYTWMIFLLDDYTVKRKEESVRRKQGAWILVTVKWSVTHSTDPPWRSRNIQFCKWKAERSGALPVLNLLGAKSLPVKLSDSWNTLTHPRQNHLHEKWAGVFSVKCVQFHLLTSEDEQRNVWTVDVMLLCWDNVLMIVLWW